MYLYLEAEAYENQGYDKLLLNNTRPDTTTCKTINAFLG